MLCISNSTYSFFSFLRPKHTFNMVYYRGISDSFVLFRKTKWDCAVLRSLYVFLMFSHYFQIRLSSESRLALEQPFSDWSKRSGPKRKNNIKVESKCLKVWKTNIKQRGRKLRNIGRFLFGTSTLMKGETMEGGKAGEWSKGESCKCKEKGEHVERHQVREEQSRTEKRREEKGILGFPLVSLGVIPPGLDH